MKHTTFQQTELFPGELYVHERSPIGDPDPYWDVLENHQSTFPEQVDSVLENHQSTFPEQVKQWLEKYFVTRAGRKFWYYRYCYYQGKIHHVHISYYAAKSNK
jgi:hypothetical protein